VGDRRALSQTNREPGYELVLAAGPDTIGFHGRRLAIALSSKVARSPVRNQSPWIARWVGPRREWCCGTLIAAQGRLHERVSVCGAMRRGRRTPAAQLQPRLCTGKVVVAKRPRRCCARLRARRQRRGGQGSCGIRAHNMLSLARERFAAHPASCCRDATAREFERRLMPLRQTLPQSSCVRPRPHQAGLASATLISLAHQQNARPPPRPPC